jgi:SM-20-related protein
MLAPAFDSEKIDQLIGHLADKGYGVLKDAIHEQLIDRLIDDCKSREATGDMERATVGREDNHILATRIRRVDAAWLDGSTDGEAAFLALTERIRTAINRRLFLGLFEFEAQFLTYPPGGFYQRHLDSLRGARNRIVSLVVYLNRDWQPADGGTLDIWSAPDDFETPAATVEPRAGTVVLMLSEEIPHAVRAANTTRRVIAGWFRVNASTGNRVDPAR